MNSTKTLNIELTASNEIVEFVATNFDAIEESDLIPQLIRVRFSDEAKLNFRIALVPKNEIFKLIKSAEFVLVSAFPLEVLCIHRKMIEQLKGKTITLDVDKVIFN